MRRDFAIVSGYGCDVGEEADGGFEPLRVFAEKVEGGSRWFEGGKPMSGMILVNGRRSVRLEKSGAGCRGFL